MILNPIFLGGYTLGCHSLRHLVGGAKNKFSGSPVKTSCYNCVSGLNERRREMAVLRSVGARPLHIFSLLLLEAVSLTLAGIALGLGLLYAGIAVTAPWLEQQYGLFMPLSWPTRSELTLLACIVAASVLMGCIPAWRAYRQALLDGLSIRL